MWYHEKRARRIHDKKLQRERVELSSWGRHLLGVNSCVLSRTCGEIGALVLCVRMSETVQPELSEIFADLPKKDGAFPDHIKKDLRLAKELYKSENGLIPSAACHEIFQVSRQRWHQMCNEYLFKSWTLFGKKFFSRKQLEEFYTLDRQKFGKFGDKRDVGKMVKDTLKDANSDD